MEIQALVEVMGLKEHGLSITVTQGNRELFVVSVSALREMFIVLCLLPSRMYCIWLYWYYLSSELENIISSVD